MKPVNEKSKAPAIDSAMVVLDILTHSAHPLTLSEICAQTGLPPASGHRIVNSLLAHEMVTIDPSRKKSYSIGSKIFQMASSIYSKQSMIPFFYPVAEILKNEIHKSIFLCSQVGNKMVVVAKLDSSIANPINIHIGQTMPLHDSASGKALLSMHSDNFQQSYIEDLFSNSTDIESQVKSVLPADIDGIKQDLTKAKRLGYAVVQNEYVHQFSCIAAPVLNLRNEPVATISAAITAEELTPQRARHYASNLIQAARQLSTRIV